MIERTAMLNDAQKTSDLEVPDEQEQPEVVLPVISVIPGWVLPLVISERRLSNRHDETTCENDLFARLSCERQARPTSEWSATQTQSLTLASRSVERLSHFPDATVLR